MPTVPTVGFFFGLGLRLEPRQYGRSQVIRPWKGPPFS